MKLSILLLSLTLSYNAICQLPTIKSWGGSATVNWAEEKKEADADSSGPGFFYHDCAQGVTVIGASQPIKTTISSHFMPAIVLSAEWRRGLYYDGRMIVIGT